MLRVDVRTEDVRTEDVRAEGEGTEGFVAVGVPCFSGPDHPRVIEGLGSVPGAGTFDGHTLRYLSRTGFAGKPGQSMVLRPHDGGVPLVLLGLGARDGLDHESWRRAGAALVLAAGEGGTAAMLLPAHAPGGDGVTLGAAVTEGASLAAYRFSAYRSEHRAGPLEGLTLVVGSDPSRPSDPSWADDLAAGVRRGARVSDAVGFARDLINTPPSDLTPSKMSEQLIDRFTGLPTTTLEVWDESRIAAEHLGGLLGVSRGSQEPPRFVRATYRPGGHESDVAVPHVVLVGKGITFDSGGLSLKSADGMTTMKTDMSGAAIVMAVLSACAELEVRVRVTALAPITENMPGSRALKPGDVLTIRNRSTIEVLNTDAEGRLVLADALSIAAEIEPRPAAVIDVATLTGAATVALGTGIAALFGTDDELVGRVRKAGALAGERLWPMPLPDDYDEHIESDVADMKNIGRPGQAGAIVAALLLRRFTGGLPWAHIDIAGTGRAAEASGYLTKGGTAFGVRTLLAFLDSYA